MWQCPLSHIETIVSTRACRASNCCLAPAPEGLKGAAHAGTLLDSALTSDRLVRSVNTGMHKCVDMGKEAAVRAAKLIQEKMEETRLQLDD